MTHNTIQSYTMTLYRTGWWNSRTQMANALLKLSNLANKIPDTGSSTSKYCSLRQLSVISSASLHSSGALTRGKRILTNNTSRLFQKSNNLRHPELYFSQQQFPLKDTSLPPHLPASKNLPEEQIFRGTQIHLGAPKQASENRLRSQRQRSLRYNEVDQNYGLAMGFL